MEKLIETLISDEHPVLFRGVDSTGRLIFEVEGVYITPTLSEFTEAMQTSIEAGGEIAYWTHKKLKGRVTYPVTIDPLDEPDPELERILDPLTAKAVGA